MTAASLVAIAMRQLANARPVYELHDADGCRWTAHTMPTFRDVETLRGETFEAVTLYRDGVLLATFEGDRRYAHDEAGDGEF